MSSLETQRLEEKLTPMDVDAVNSRPAQEKGHRVHEMVVSRTVMLTNNAEQAIVWQRQAERASLGPRVSAKERAR